MKEEQLRQIMQFLGKAGKLRETIRFDSTLSDHRESTADHSWRLSLMVALVAEELKIDLDVGRAMKIALVHDLAESVTGDIDAYRVITHEYSKEDKDRKEKEAITKILAGFSFKDNIKNLWNEYFYQETREARFVKALDRIEAFLTILESGHASYLLHLFYSDYADEAVRNFSELADFLKVVKEELRQELSKGNIGWVE
ncbi:hypothetical protein COV20_00345 [Candidatus Woesearchaeota archaeon CG10_big_fil_rev_8_21_14_0_10_45_16]|nr:MAG: hypothetical protein COV20_00345 [Candidatus Woesearchaeota archaeon CG10_big_fil_rev_8_21_14_0_10_45_16]